MKKQLLIVGLWVCSGMLCQPIQAQSVDKANEEYKTFVRLNNENGDKGTLYSTLYSCYKEYVAVLSSLKPGNPSYDQARVHCGTFIRIYNKEPSITHKKVANKMHYCWHKPILTYR